MDIGGWAQCEKIFESHVHDHQGASPTEEALNIQVEEADQSDDFTVCLSSELSVLAHV